MFFFYFFFRHDDLKEMLDSNKDSLKLEAMKRIVAVSITVWSSKSESAPLQQKVKAYVFHFLFSSQQYCLLYFLLQVQSVIDYCNDSLHCQLIYQLNDSPGERLNLILMVLLHWLHISCDEFSPENKPPSLANFMCSGIIISQTS